IGGWWPIGYNCMRYYWYDWHPNYWYGYSPVPRVVDGDTYNTYTYNYYGAGGTPAVYGDTLATVNGPEALTSADPTTFADGREKIVGEEVPPQAAGEADRKFETGVQAFEQGDYQRAAVAFQEAMVLAPEDVIMPFAYAQTLFALEDYDASVMALRQALVQPTPAQETVGVFYPRGLYEDDDALYTQIDAFIDRVETQAENTDLQLLLGYHLLGIGEANLALQPLEKANQDPNNRKAVETLKELAQRIIAETPAGTESLTNE
ncbi:tetratricopeptide repeat protein, partial [Planctomycetota bacterium]